MRKRFFRRDKDSAVLSLEAADQMLANVFRACEVEPNTVPLQTLTSYSSYRRERFYIHRVLIGIIMAVFLLLPLLFVPPELSAVQSGTEDGLPVWSITVRSLLPVRGVSAEIGGHNIPVYLNGAERYLIQPTANGEMTVTVTALNGQRTAETVQVSGADTEAPTVTDTSWDDAYVYLTVEDADSGVRFDSVYLTDENGAASAPYDIDEETGIVTLAYPQSRTDVYISDNAGNTLHLAITPQE